MNKRKSSKKLLIVFIVLLIVFLLGRIFLVGKISDNLQIAPYTGSALFTEDDLTKAIDKTELYFEKNMQGCTMSAIGYAGDQASQNQLESRKRNPNFKYNEVVVMKIDFDVRIGSSKFDSGTEKKDYVIVLGRKSSDSKWKVLD